MDTTTIGRKGENLVAEFLRKSGYTVLEVNWKRPHAEIDIVAKKGGTIYFIEVKSRSSLVAGDGFEYITKKKLLHMTRAAESWVLENNWTGAYELLAASVFGQNVELREV